MSEALALSIVVEDDAMLRAFHSIEDGLKRLVTMVAEDYAHEVELEAGRQSSRLGRPWAITGTGPTERHVSAPEFWAGFLAHGTKAHGPTKATKLVFTVNGDMVFADFVSGIPASHFDEAAAEKTRSHLDSIMEKAIHAQA